MHFMGTKSRDTIFGPSVRASAERAAAARKEADRLACEAWNKRMLGYRGPAQPSPTLDPGNAGTSFNPPSCIIGQIYYDGAGGIASGGASSK